MLEFVFIVLFNQRKHHNRDPTRILMLGIYIPPLEVFICKVIINYICQITEAGSKVQYRKGSAKIQRSILYDVVTQVRIQ